MDSSIKRDIIKLWSIWKRLLLQKQPLYYSINWKMQRKNWLQRIIKLRNWQSSLRKNIWKNNVDCVKINTFVWSNFLLQSRAGIEDEFFQEMKNIMQNKSRYYLNNEETKAIENLNKDFKNIKKRWHEWL